jgi:lycopene cyclase domain-containing protein
VTYTALSVVGVLAAVALDVLVLRTRLVLGRAFWLTYAIVLVGQLVTNGVLTGQRIVRYDPSAILGGASVVAFGDWRVAWAPVEDLLFGFSLVLQTLAWWVFWGRRLPRPSGPDQRGSGDREAST